MNKKSVQTRARDTEKAALISRTARICGVTERYVRYVLNGDYDNEKVFSTYMELRETSRDLDNKLVAAVRQAVKF